MSDKEVNKWSSKTIELTESFLSKPTDVSCEAVLEDARDTLTQSVARYNADLTYYKESSVLLVVFLNIAVLMLLLAVNIVADEDIALPTTLLAILVIFVLAPVAFFDRSPDVLIRLASLEALASFIQRRSALSWTAMAGSVTPSGKPYDFWEASLRDMHMNGAQKYHGYKLSDQIAMYAVRRLFIEDAYVTANETAMQ